MTPRRTTAVGLLALITLSATIQAWVIAHARVPALDAVNFVAHAQWIERDGVIAALSADPAPPLYPLSILAVRRAADACGCELTWGLAAQLAAAIPLVLCIVPVFALARQVTSNTRAAFIAGLLFVVMTQVARMGAEALSDSAHLLCFCTALVCAGSAITAQSTRRRVVFSLTGGMCIGLAILARVEAWVLLPAVALTPLCVVDQSWLARLRQASLHTLGTLAGIALVVGLCFAPLGVQQPHDLVERLLARRGFVEETPLNLPPTIPHATFADSADWQLTSGESMQFGRKDPSVSIRFRGLVAAVTRFVDELLQSWQYLVGLLAAVGCLIARDRWWRPIVWLHRNVFLIFTLGLLAFATRHGYLERRHLLPLVVVSLPWASCGVLWLGEKWAALRNWQPGRSQVAVASITAVLLVSTTLLPLHPGRTAHREAAEWLRAQLDGGSVLDTIGHSALYTDRTTYRHEIAPAALADPSLQFMVIETSELGYNSGRAATLRELVARFGTLAARFEPPAGRVGPTVHVYRWSPDRFAWQHGRSYAR